MHEKLLGQENEILSENSALWEKVFMAADKGMVMTEDGKNYVEVYYPIIEYLELTIFAVDHEDAV